MAETLDSGRHFRVSPVLLSGGSGTRLWPLSRESHPKQFIPLLGERSLIQQSADRVADPLLYEPPIVVCGDDQRFFVADQLQKYRPTIILEAISRNTAFPVAVAALHVFEMDPERIILVCPADHDIVGQADFDSAVERAARCASRGYISTLGVRPRWPEPGYGHILPGDPVPGCEDASTIACFVEKPDQETASSFVRDGRWLWNAGIFVLSARTALEELEAHAPETLKAARSAHADALSDLDFLRLDQAASVQAPNVSFDVAIMERTERAAVVPVEFQWSDVGSWRSFWMLQPRDPNGNVTRGDVMLEDVSDSYLHADSGLIAAIGVRDVVVIATDDAVLIADRERTQEVKALVARMKSDKRKEALEHRKVYRPWGYFQSIAVGDRFQVKILGVKPGAKLSLQSHNHRAEHWVCVNGTAVVTVDGTDRLLRENESAYIPLGSVHRLENPGRIELRIIEVQSGAYLGEDDIIRFADDYARCPTVRASAQVRG